MRPASRPLFLAIACFCAAVPALAGPVTGVVVDPDARPLPGATVLLVRGGNVLAAATTDARGAFRLEAPAEAGLEVRVAVDGFRARPVAIAASGAPLDLGTIALAISAVSESVVVSAAHVEIPLSTTSSSVTIVGGDELKARQTANVADALRLVPGVSVAATGGRGAVTGVFPRGGESDYALVFIDGVQANAFGGGFDFGHLPVDDVDRIEIVRGPQSALYGSNAIGAVVRVVTKRGGRPEAEGTIEGGSFGTLRASATTAGGAAGWQWGASAEREASDGATGDPAASGAVVTNDDYARHSLSGGGGWSNGRGRTVRGDVRYSGSDRGFPGPFGSDPGGTFGGIDAISRGRDSRWLASSAAGVPLSPRVRVQGQASHARLDSEFISPFGESESWSRRTGGRVQADLALASALEGSTGVEIQRETAGGTFITASGAREVPVERGLAGAFAEARWNGASRIFVTAGVRAERITRKAFPGDAGAVPPRPEFLDDTVVSVNPKIAAAWFVRSRGGDFTRVRASAGTGIRPPDAFEIAFTDNPSLKPERNRSLDAGLDHAWLDGLALVEATAFVNRYDDLIVAVGSFRESSRFRTDNISNARSRGLEIAGTARARRRGPGAADLRVRVGYTLLDTEILAVDRGTAAPSPFATGDALLRRPWHQFSADVMVTAGAFGAFAGGRGRGRFRDVDPSFGTFGGVYDAPGFAAWDLGASWRFPHLEAFARVTNLFDRAYEEALGFPAPGRGLYAGIRVASRR